MKHFSMFIALSFMTFNLSAKSFVIEENSSVLVDAKFDKAKVANTAFNILQNDLKNVMNVQLVLGKNHPTIKTKITGKLKHPEEFKLFVDNKGVLNIHASDEHGLAYGFLEISRLIGVSPWEWWADATPKHKSRFQLDEGFVSSQFPNVRYRGIFINDEDWGLMPWSYLTMEPGNPKGVIGKKTTERIFELLLRLRSNTYWPPMHECSLPYFMTEGNRDVAERYGIYIGTSHCEPMACNANGEWKLRGQGEYNYVTNPEGVKSFWQERIDSVKDQEIIYTVGMRGIHDGVMQGVNTLKEHKNVLQQVIYQQLKMLPEGAPKVFVPYKEVLDVYNQGLDLQDDITLMWTDDNYGYIRHFPTDQERNRKGGNGVYYHVSYWGRPHDYLWLGTFSPYLLYQQMNEAYDRGIQEMWILNVGDIKPAEYQTELFMDMAWNIGNVRKSGVNSHLADFLSREFGSCLNPDDINCLTDIMNDAFRLAFVRKPEMMSNTRTEENDKVYWHTIRAIDWNHVMPNVTSDEYAQKRLDDYDRISTLVETIWNKISHDRRDCFYQLVKYPVQAAAMMNKKILVWQFLEPQSAEPLSQAAYDSIAAMTQRYNQGFHNNGKWNHMMDMAPRVQPVFQRIHSLADNNIGKQKTDLIDYTILNPEITTPLEGLGYEGKAFQINKDSQNHPLTISFNASSADSLDIAIAVIPTLPVDNIQNALTLQIDNGPLGQLNFETFGRSEQWKLNVLANRSIQHIKLPVADSTDGEHKLYIRSLSDALIIDNIYIIKIQSQN